MHKKPRKEGEKMFGKNTFRKILSNAGNGNSDKSKTFRKHISERLSAPLKTNNLERIPGHDMLAFE